MKCISSVLMISALMLPVFPAFAGEPANASIEELAVRLATTPEQHAVVANYYRQKEADARASAASHRSMKQAYGAGKLRDKQRMEAHCDKLIASYEALASEYDEMAKGEDEAAKK